MSPERLTRPELNRELVTAYTNTFISRFDRYALQKPDGSYRSVSAELTLELVLAHLHGIKTLGAYALAPDNAAHWICFDADDSEDEADCPLWDALRNLSVDLAAQHVPSYLEKSRRGGHLWLFTPPLSGTDARRLGKQLLTERNLLGEIELYPKQDVLQTGPGSFVRLPLGIHRRAIPPRRFHFVHANGAPLAPSVREQIQLLASPARVPQDFIQQVLDCAPESTPHFPTPSFRDKKHRIVGNTPSERIKNTVSVREFVSQFVELDRSNRGLCPFHDDHRVSFSVNVSGNYWNCFAGCGGGSIIDFWIRWRRLKQQSDRWNDVVGDLMELLHL